MSRTNHQTIPAFPRALRGSRGGRHRAPTPCVECVGFTSCRPGACSAPFGCESWVDEDGRRVELDPRIDYDTRDDLATIDEPALATVEPEPEWERAHKLRTRFIDTRQEPEPEPDPDDTDPYAPSSATLSEMSGIFPTDDNDPGPLFRGPESN